MPLLHHPLSQSTSPLSASCDQRAPISLASVVSHDPGMASRQVAPPIGS
uniref:Uncharacterized protein n=1 Tax=Anguilla anguilla TaxID=7936 RepID=A0A0E9Q8F8_ANGAN